MPEHYNNPPRQPHAAPESVLAMASGIRSELGAYVRLGLAIGALSVQVMLSELSPAQKKARDDLDALLKKYDEASAEEKAKMHERLGRDFTHKDMRDNADNN